MGEKHRRRQRKKAALRIWMAVVAVAVLTGAGLCYVLFSGGTAGGTSPEELLVRYMDYIPRREYEQMYAMLDVEASGSIRLEDFVKRNSAIYEGIGMENLEISVRECDREQNRVTYQMSFDTIAGKISFENSAVFVEGEKGEYGLAWDDRLIFPRLGYRDKVRVSVIQAKRGAITDREGRILAGEGTASSVGIVPGKLENRAEAIAGIAELLGIGPETIEKKLAAKWVRDDSFVPVGLIPKVEEIDFLTAEPQEEALRERERQEKLLAIPGVMLSDAKVRAYPYGRATSHLTGYVQKVTAEDLEAHEGEGYTADDLIGRSGLEALFEKELKGRNGCRISIVGVGGSEKEELACLPVRHGETIKLTVDAALMSALYEEFREDMSCTVAMDPHTGEVLALVSTPAYDSNDFILGLSGEAWAALSEDAQKPMYNRFRQVWCPGSVFKPVTAAVGLESGAIDPAEDYGNVGRSWQKDASWGSYCVTTLHTYEPVVLENALIYSDNIYFAKAALKIGAPELEKALAGFGFGGEIPFEIRMAESQYSNTGTIETEIQLADSGYGQGEILVNPLHLACIYSAFCNGGNMVKPYLVHSGEAAEYWIPGAFSTKTAARVLDGMKKVVNHPEGTGYGAHRDDVLLAGKTGTAEIKASKEDTSGTELGWFAVCTADENTERAILLVSMTEDVKERGGSGYVVAKDSRVLEKWFSEGR